MLTVLGERIYLRSNIFNKELENIFKKTPIRNEEVFGWSKKNTLKGVSSWLSDTEECICDLEDRIMDITNQKSKKANFKKWKQSRKYLW